VSRRARGIHLVAIAALLLIVVFANPPSHTQFLYVLHKSAHSVVFALVGVLCLRLIPEATSWWTPYVGALSAVLIMGVGTEIAQAWVNRDSSALDVLRDVVGGCAGLSIALFGRRRTQMSRAMRARVGLFAAVATIGALAPLTWCLSAYANRDLRFPVIWQYRTPLDMYFVTVWAGRVSAVDLPTRWARRSDESAIEVVPDPSAGASIALYAPYPDWRTHTTLSIEFTNPSQTPVTLMVRVNSESVDWSDHWFELMPDTRATLRLRLSDIRLDRSGVELNRADVVGLGLAASSSQTAFYVNRIALE
jgi:VanZ family protein